MQYQDSPTAMKPTNHRHHPYRRPAELLHTPKLKEHDYYNCNLIGQYGYNSKNLWSRRRFHRLNWWSNPSHHQDHSEQMKPSHQLPGNGLNNVFFNTILVIVNLLVLIAIFTIVFIFLK